MLKNTIVEKTVNDLYVHKVFFRTVHVLSRVLMFFSNEVKQKGMTGHMNNFFKSFVNGSLLLEVRVCNDPSLKIIGTTAESLCFR